MRFDVRAETFPIRGRFSISRGAKTVAEVVVTELTAHGFVGRGECVPYARYGETVAGVMRDIANIAADLPELPDLKALEKHMPPGAARNGLDCALVDLHCQINGVPATQLLGLEPTEHEVVTAYTISLDTPPAMALAAETAKDYPLLKIKLGGTGDQDRLAAIRAAAPNARLIGDANEGWSGQELDEMLSTCAHYGVEMVEQPLPAGADQMLVAGRAEPLLCADESVHDLSSLDAIVGHYDAINVKLDKTGGITDALDLIRAARERGLKVMVGCMLGTSLGVAPALSAAGLADWVDLDGPLLLAEDRIPGVVYERGRLIDRAEALWGYPRTKA